MKRLFSFLLILILFIGCNPSQDNIFSTSAFSLYIPEPFEEVQNQSIICFAPYGDPLLSSSITISSTEKW